MFARKASEPISTRQYNRIFHCWIEKLGLDSSLYSTHSMRRTKPYLIYKKTKNLRIIQLLLGHKSWKALYVTSELKWMTRLIFLSQLRSNC
ncbi:MAG: hypothetical protein FH730_06940 [Idiomarina piscisalsi]|nr:hypothetical protein [Idiomarina piscisalsi]